MCREKPNATSSTASQWRQTLRSRSSARRLESRAATPYPCYKRKEERPPWSMQVYPMAAFRRASLRHLKLCTTSQIETRIRHKSHPNKSRFRESAVRLCTKPAARKQKQGPEVGRSRVKPARNMALPCSTLLEKICYDEDRIYLMRDSRTQG